ncbi:hypothetical protein PGT21_030646 [Puccinia graminis f. sp. tritici]|uniref:Uncharacterized protein n=1 Tax=Puccinia graminis f. sp. tritici TaxID=56615 RepID=A0A5B0R7G4_PUCGR|nr:hypothetical protein PGT21_030646 [Puccinia graminis f. sp. tritici]KAA1121530.1 hypothetical protein PGTUg99_031110 [Puccinia graminis f. sp. tritici]
MPMLRGRPGHTYGRPEPLSSSSAPRDISEARFASAWQYRYSKIDETRSSKASGRVQKWASVTTEDTSNDDAALQICPSSKQDHADVRYAVVREVGRVLEWCRKIDHRSVRAAGSWLSSKRGPSVVQCFHQNDVRAHPEVLHPRFPAKQNFPPSIYGLVLVQSPLLKEVHCELVQSAHPHQKPEYHIRL